MRCFVKILSIAILMVAAANSAKISKKAVEPYSYPTPAVQFNGGLGTSKSKVSVETIKSVAPPEYVPSLGNNGGNFKGNFPSGKTPVGSVTFNAFQADTSSTKVTSDGFGRGNIAPNKQASSFGYHGSSEKSLSHAFSSSFAPSRAGSLSGGPTGGLQSFNGGASSSGFFTSGVKSFGQNSFNNGGGSNFGINKVGSSLGFNLVGGSGVKVAGGKGGTGSNTFKFGGSSAGTGPRPSGGSQGGMMGASYMRSSSPYYNFNVMLD